MRVGEAEKVLARATRETTLLARSRIEKDIMRLVCNSMKGIGLGIEGGGGGDFPQFVGKVEFEERIALEVACVG